MYRLVCTCGETFEGSTLTPNDVIMDESILEIILEGSLWVLPSIQPKHSPRKTSNVFFFFKASLALTKTGRHIMLVKSLLI